MRYGSAIQVYTYYYMMQRSKGLLVVVIVFVVSHRRLPRLLPNVAHTGAARPPGASVDVVHPTRGDEVGVRGVLSDGDLDGLHLRELFS